MAAEVDARDGVATAWWGVAWRDGYTVHRMAWHGMAWHYMKQHRLADPDVHIPVTHPPARRGMSTEPAPFPANPQPSQTPLPPSSPSHTASSTAARASCFVPGPLLPVRVVRAPVSMASPSVCCGARTSGYGAAPVRGLGRDERGGGGEGCSMGADGHELSRALIYAIR